MIELGLPLEAAFSRLSRAPLDAGAAADPGCRGKLGIVEALRSLGARSATVFAQAARCRQLEPVFGGRQDTAGPLRCAGLAGLIEMNDPDALLVAARLLADDDPPVRVAVAAALSEPDAFVDPVPSVALLTLRALSGDPESEVVQACLQGLLTLNPGEESLDFVGRRLASEHFDECEAAAYALAGARQAEALARLIAWHQSELLGPRRRVALTAIALARLGAGFDYLYRQLLEGDSGSAVDAIDALAVYAGDEAIRERALAALAQRGDAALMRQAEASL